MTNATRISLLKDRFFLPLRLEFLIALVAATIWFRNTCRHSGLYEKLGDVLAGLYPRPESREHLHVVAAATTVRFLWNSAALVFVMFILVTLGVAFKVMRSATAEEGLDKVRSRIAMIVSSVLIAAALLWRWFSSYGIATPYLKQVFEKVLPDVESQAGFAGPSPAVWTDLTGGTDVLVAAVIVFVAFAFGGLIHDMTSVELDGLRRRRQKATRLLYSSAALLVAAVVHLLILLSWPAAYLSDQHSAMDFRMMASGMTLMVGVFFSLLLLAIAWPVFSLIDERARERVKEEFTREGQTDVSDAEIERRLTKRGFSLAVWSRAGKILAVLSPMIAGILGSPATSLFKSLFGAGG